MYTEKSKLNNWRRYSREMRKKMRKKTNKKRRNKARRKRVEGNNIYIYKVTSNKLRKKK